MGCLGGNGEKPATVERGELEIRRSLGGGMADAVSTSNVLGANQSYSHYSLDHSAGTMLGDKASQSHLMVNRNSGEKPHLLEWTFDWKYMVRGLVLDKKRGNILKMDRRKYVKVAYHGFRELSKEDKGQDNNPGKVPEGADYSRMYKDVRAAVDLCHRDGTLKQMVAKDPRRYINEDTSIVPMFKMLRDSGRSTFLVTNSLWFYTNIVMNFLFSSRTMDGGITCNFDWLQYFDVVITGSAKPGFFHEDNRANIFEVEPESGMLLNTANGTPMPQGGSVGHPHKLLSIESSSQVILCLMWFFMLGTISKEIFCATRRFLDGEQCLLFQSLRGRLNCFGNQEICESFISLATNTNTFMQQLRLLRNERDLVEDQIHHLKWSLKFENLRDDEKQKMTSALGELESQRDQVRLAHQQAQRDCHQKIWGQLMKTGYQNSSFARQVERFACLYTSQVSNLSLYSPDKYYRPGEDFMPHEFHILLPL
ncbi:hypothetical protein CRYUN_Cryun30bG0022800 [Craigia yunnanensis]